jgi:hypothetical protein
LVVNLPGSGRSSRADSSSRTTDSVTHDDGAVPDVQVVLGEIALGSFQLCFRRPHRWRVSCVPSEREVDVVQLLTPSEHLFRCLIVGMNDA